MIYLDHNATTPVRPEVVDAMLPYLRESYGNPNSVHQLGQRSRKAIEAAREHVAALIGAFPDEIVFTSCGSESDALAIQGAAEERRRATDGHKNHVVTSAVEHEAVVQTCAELEKRGFEVTKVACDNTGRLKPADVAAAIRPETAVVSVMWANNELGTLEPVEEIGKICKAAPVLFHSDAVQAVGKVPVDVNAANVSLLSLSGHKLNAPKGVAALYVRRGVVLAPLVTGNQERARRGGTENVASIVGLGEACRLWKDEQAAHRKHLERLRKHLIAGLESIEGCRINGNPDHHLPNTVHVCFDGVDGAQTVVALDLAGFCVSSGSACASGSTDPGHVMSAIGYTANQCRGAIRVSIGWGTTEQDLDAFVEAAQGALSKLRKVSV